MNEQQFIEHLTAVTEKYAKSIDQAITKTSLDLIKEPKEINESSQMTALLMTAARRTVRAGLPDIGLFTALREALTGAREEYKEIQRIEALRAKEQAPKPPAKKPAAPVTAPKK